MLLGAAILAGCEQPSAANFEALFGDGDSGLTAETMAGIFAAFSDGLTLSPDGKVLADPNCGDVMPATEVVDLNADARPEVFISWGNACTSGMTGRSLTLFVDATGNGYTRQLGFPVGGWRALDTASSGWPDLELGGPGFCHAVWAWQGSAYAFRCNRPEVPDGCVSEQNVCPLE